MSFALFKLRELKKTLIHQTYKPLQPLRKKLSELCVKIVFKVNLKL